MLDDNMISIASTVAEGRTFAVSFLCCMLDIILEIVDTAMEGRCLSELGSNSQVMQLCPFISCTSEIISPSAMHQWPAGHALSVIIQWTGAGLAADIIGSSAPCAHCSVHPDTPPSVLLWSL